MKTATVIAAAVLFSVWLDGTMNAAYRLAIIASVISAVPTAFSGFKS